MDIGEFLIILPFEISIATMLVAIIICIVYGLLHAVGFSLKPNKSDICHIALRTIAVIGCLIIVNIIVYVLDHYVYHFI